MLNKLNCLDSHSFTKALEQLVELKSIGIKCLDDKNMRDLIAIVDNLPRRAARPIVSNNKAPVYQDFDLCYNIPKDNLLWCIAKELDAYVKIGMRNLNLIGHEVFQFNDIIVQYYSPKSRGITPHRDSIRYKFIIAILILSGDGNFNICDTRDGAGAKRIPAKPGDLILMAGSDLAGHKLGPIHFMENVTKKRRTIGFRYDSMDL